MSCFDRDLLDQTQWGTEGGISIHFGSFLQCSVVSNLVQKVQNGGHEASSWACVSIFKWGGGGGKRMCGFVIKRKKYKFLTKKFLGSNLVLFPF